MNWFKTVKRYYGLGLYSVDDVRVFVEANRITEQEFKQITKEDYNSPEITKQV